MRGRPAGTVKTGLRSFHVDTSEINDDSFQRIMDCEEDPMLGFVTFTVYHLIRCYVLENGSYLRKNRKQLVGWVMGMTSPDFYSKYRGKGGKNYAEKAIDRLIEIGLLDGESLQDGIITSVWMQKKNRDSCIAMHRSLDESNYWLLEPSEKDGEGEPLKSAPKNRSNVEDCEENDFSYEENSIVSEEITPIKETKLNKTRGNIISLSHPSIQGKPGGSEDEDGCDRRRMPPSGRKKSSVPDITAMVRSIRERIEYPVLTANHYSDKGTIDTMVNILLETELANADTLTVSGIEYPAEFVKNRLAGIDSGHIEYVLDCLSSAGKIRNIKNYLLAALFNAPATIDGSCEAEVRRDTPWLKQG